jgi:hypothetical protein
MPLQKQSSIRHFAVVCARNYFHPWDPSREEDSGERDRVNSLFHDDRCEQEAVSDYGFWQNLAKSFWQGEAPLSHLLKTVDKVRKHCGKL